MYYSHFIFEVMYHCSVIYSTNVSTKVDNLPLCTLQIFTTWKLWGLGITGSLHCKYIRPDYNGTLAIHRNTYYDEWLEFHHNLVVYICSVLFLSCFKLSSNKRILNRKLLTQPNFASFHRSWDREICAVQAENVSSVFTLAPVIMYEPVLPKWGKL